MAFETPKNRLNIRQIRNEKQRVPLEQIIAIEGHSPIATGIETAGNVIGQALMRRAENRRLGEELARSESLIGLQPGELSGFSDLGQATSLGKYAAENRKPTYIQQINPDGTATLLEVPAGGKFGGVVKTPGQTAAQKKQSKGVTLSGESVFFDPVSGLNMTPDNKPYSGPIYPTTVGTEEQRREALVSGAKTSINAIRNSVTPEVLTELKAIRLSPFRVYAQLASSEAKELYINLRESIANEIYLKTGATANPTELENATVSYLASLNDSPQDFLMRMDLLERNIEPFAKRGGGLPELPKPGPREFPKESKEERKARLLREAQGNR